MTLDRDSCGKCRGHGIPILSHMLDLPKRQPPLRGEVAADRNQEYQCHGMEHSWRVVVAMGTSSDRGGSLAFARIPPQSSLCGPPWRAGCVAEDSALVHADNLV